MSDSERERPLEDLGFGREDQPDDDLVVNRELEETVALEDGWQVDDPSQRSRGGGAGRWILVGFLILLLAGALWWFLGRGTPKPETLAAPAPAEATAEAEPKPLGKPAEELDPLEIPGLDQSDEVVRQLVARLSNHPELAAWLATDRLVRRFVVSVVNVSEGVNPRKHLPVQKLEGAYAVDRVGGGTYPDPTSYDRYGLAVAVFTSIDPEGAAELYSRLRPLFTEAYRDLGYPRGDFDDAMRATIERLLQAPIPETPPALVQGVGVWRYEDPRLEALPAVEKQFLRLGPTQQRAVKEQLQRLASALGMS